MNNWLTGISTPNRIYWLDFGKVLAAFLVVFGHLYTGDHPINKYLYAFHVPFFFIVSGIFHKNEGKVLWKDHVRKILFPAVLFFAVYAVFYVLVHSVFIGSPELFLNEAVTYAKYFILRMWRSTEIGPGWFLMALFWCKIITDLVLMCKGKTIILANLIIAIGLIVPYVLGFRIPLFFSQGLMAYPFYIAGFKAKEFLKQQQASWRYLIPVFVCLAGTILLSRLNGKVSMSGVYFGGLPTGVNVIVFYLNAFIGSAMLLAFSLLPFPSLKSIRLLATSLLTIIGIQSIYIDLFSMATGGLNQPLWLSLIASVVILWLCFFTHLLIKPIYFNKK